MSFSITHHFLFALNLCRERLRAVRSRGQTRRPDAADFQPAKRRSADGIVLRIHGYVAGMPYTIFPGNFPVADWVVHRSGRLWLLVRWDHYEEDVTCLLKELSRMRLGRDSSAGSASASQPPAISPGSRRDQGAAESDR